MLGDAGSDERMRDLEQERGRSAEQEECLAVETAGHRIAREDAGVAHTSSVPLLRSFSYALDGLAHLMRTQRNFRIELAIGAAAVVGGIWASLAPIEWIALALTIALVLILEAVNTAIEHAVTLASPAVDPRAKAAKDVSAAAVLIAAVAAVAVGALLFGPRLLR